MSTGNVLTQAKTNEVKCVRFATKELGLPLKEAAELLLDASNLASSMHEVDEAGIQERSLAEFI